MTIQINCIARDQITLHLPALRAFALGLTRSPDRADDLVQDSVVKAWVHIDTFRPGSNLRGWLFTIMRNGYYSGLRKSLREVSDPEGIQVARLMVQPAHDGALAMREFQTAFAQLSPEHREVLSLVGAMGYSYEEAATATRLAVGTVKSRVSRARVNLAGLLDLTVGESVLPAIDGALIAVQSRAPAYVM